MIFLCRTKLNEIVCFLPPRSVSKFENFLLQCRTFPIYRTRTQSRVCTNREPRFKSHCVTKSWSLYFSPESQRFDISCGPISLSFLTKQSPPCTHNGFSRARERENGDGYFFFARTAQEVRECRDRKTGVVCDSKEKTHELLALL